MKVVCCIDSVETTMEMKRAFVQKHLRLLRSLFQHYISNKGWVGDAVFGIRKTEHLDYVLILTCYTQSHW